MYSRNFLYAWRLATMVNAVANGYTAATPTAGKELRLQLLGVEEGSVTHQLRYHIFITDQPGELHSH